MNGGFNRAMIWNTAKATQKWFVDKNTDVLKWPSQPFPEHSEAGICEEV